MPIYTGAQVLKKYAIAPNTLTKYLKTGKIKAGRAANGTWMITDEALREAGIILKSEKSETVVAAKKIIDETDFLARLSDLEKRMRENEKILDEHQKTREKEREEERVRIHKLVEIVKALKTQIDNQLPKINNIIFELAIRKLVTESIEEKLGSRSDYSGVYTSFLEEELNKHVQHLKEKYGKSKII